MYKCDCDWRNLDNVKMWLSANKLKLNKDKMEFIIFGLKRQPFPRQSETLFDLTHLRGYLTLDAALITANALVGGTVLLYFLV